MSVFVVEEAPILRTRSMPIKKITKRHKEQIEEIKKAVLANPGAAAIAANQIGYNLRAFVCLSKEELMTIINPKIVWTSMDNIEDIVMDDQGVAPKVATLWEGCLSFPGRNFLVTRPYAIKVQYMNEKGVSKQVTLNDTWARVFLHEINHLDGVVIPDLAEETVDQREEGVVHNNTFLS
jgi:peptide deformylase